MAFGLWGLTVFASICQHQFFYRSMSTGVSARSTLISALYQRVFQLSTGARLQHPNGKLLTAISSDISRIDYCAQWFHAVWTAPIQLGLCLGEKRLAALTSFTFTTNRPIRPCGVLPIHSPCPCSNMVYEARICCSQIVNGESCRFWLTRYGPMRVRNPFENCSARCISSKCLPMKYHSLIVSRR